MKNSRRSRWILIVVLSLAGCSSFVASVPRQSPGPDDMPETVNHTPMQNQILLASDYKGHFLTSIIKATLKQYPDGGWRFDQNQQEITDGSVMSTACPTAPDHINDMVPFRKQAEVYLLPNQNGGEKVALRIDGKEREIKFRNRCRTFDNPEDLVLIPYVKDGAQFEVRGLAGKKKQLFPVPRDFAPLILLRYQEGQMIFIPMRLDTVTLDSASERMILVYRATFPVVPKLRKIEHMAVLPVEMSPHGRSDNDLRWDREALDYLRRCPVPLSPVEPCSHPATPQNPVLFGATR